MVISTPRLCNDVAFQPPATVKPWRISCKPIIPEDGAEEYFQRKAHEIGMASQDSARLAEDDVTLDFLKMLGIDIKDITGDGQLFQEGTDGKLVEIAGKPRKVGGIEVGGHNILPEGTKLEKGSVVGGHDKLLMTVAASDGFMATPKDLARLKLRGFEAIEEMKRKVEVTANGAEWRLDVYETAQGPQLRAIIGEGALTGEEKERREGAKGAKEEKRKGKRRPRRSRSPRRWKRRSRRRRKWRSRTRSLKSWFQSTKARTTRTMLMRRIRRTLTDQVDFRYHFAIEMFCIQDAHHKGHLH